MAGTEYAGQCFCGNSLTTTTPLDEGKCDMPCNGDATQTCGGSLALSVYSSSATAKKQRRHARHMDTHLLARLS